MSKKTSRRNFLRAGTLVGTVGISGCLDALGGSLGGGSEGDSSTSGTSGAGNKTSRIKNNASTNESQVTDQPQASSAWGASVKTNYVVEDSGVYVAVELADNVEADYVEVNFKGDAEAVGRLYEVGDELVLRSRVLETGGYAEDLTTWNRRNYNGAQYGDTVQVTATAYNDGSSAVIYQNTKRLGPSSVRAKVGYQYDASNDKVKVFLRSKGNSDYVEVRFEEVVPNSGVKAVVKLKNPGDQAVLTPTGLRTMGNTQDVTQERGYSVSPTGSDDQIRVVADAHIKPRNFSKKMRDRRRVLPGERVVSGGKIIPEGRVGELKENIGDEDELPGKSWREIMKEDDEAVPRGFVIDNCDPDIKVDPSPVPNKYSCELYRKPEYNKHVFRQGMTSTVLDVTGDLSGVTEAT